ncbi:hypothetical protein PoB_002584700 [Plakobranchus ocellatus]|uniref:Uncharacterized protein n=1 Tax=Plakobranchus ocellatus TaxID=259542 RepID=A0AAV3ZXD0_9GAST|nr:hypothetical protein PoB_002584700 [Plakobranchus ocellatus]
MKRKRMLLSRDWVLCIASPPQSDLRLLSPPSGQGTGGGAKTHNRKVPADLRADSLATVPPKLREGEGEETKTKNMTPREKTTDRMKQRR